MARPSAVNWTDPPPCGRQVWSKLDMEVAETQMPERYQNCYAKILCNDCQTKSVATFHIIGLKCAGCGSYNTARGDGPLYKRNGEPRAGEGTPGRWR